MICFSPLYTSLCVMKYDRAADQHVLTTWPGCGRADFLYAEAQARRLRPLKWREAGRPSPARLGRLRRTVINSDL